MNGPTQPAAARLYSSLGTDPDLGQLVDLFVEEMPGRVAGVLEQLSRDDWDGLRQTAHQLKGAAGSYGFQPITASAARVEDAIREGLPEEQIRRAVGELTDLCSRAHGGAPS
jgi:HPt (histidine-containing phosphotransfer) domain-containing protein